MQQQSLRDDYYEYFSQSEKVENGKTFMGLPQFSARLTERHTLSRDASPARYRSRSTNNDLMTSGGGKRQVTVLDPQLKGSLNLIHQKECSLEAHDSAVHDLIGNLNRAFQPPRAIYGDIEPDAELLPSQVTLLRLRRKRQDAAVARYRYQKAVTRYIVWWRDQLLRRYRAHYGRVRALAHLTCKGYNALRAGLQQYRERNARHRRAMGLAIAACLIKNFTIWRNKEAVNKKVRYVNRKFTVNFCAWKRWQSAFKRRLMNSMVGMQADMTAYDYVLRKHGRLVLNALHVKRPLVDPRKVSKFARLQALKRGFDGIANQFFEKQYVTDRLRNHTRSKKAKLFSWWLHYVKCRATNSDIRAKAREMLRRRQVITVKTRTSDEACKLGLQNYLHSWKTLLHNNYYQRFISQKAKEHRYKSVMMHGVSKWLYACHHGCTRQTRALKVAAKHLLLTKVQQSFTTWRKHVNCQSEKSDAEEPSQLLMNHSKRERRRRLLDNAQGYEMTTQLTISKNKLDMASALYQFKSSTWARVCGMLLMRMKLNKWLSSDHDTAACFHDNTLAKAALNQWLQIHEEGRICQKNYEISDDHYSTTHMRVCVMQWHDITQMEVSVLRPAMNLAEDYHLRKVGFELFDNLMRSGYIKRQQHRACVHWADARRCSVLATLAAIVNTRRQSTLHLTDSDPTLLNAMSTMSGVKCGKLKRAPTGDIIQCSRGVTPAFTLFATDELMLCSKIYEERRKRKTAFGEWASINLKRREERLYESQVEESHYAPRLLQSGMQGLAEFAAYCLQLRAQERQMDEFYDSSKSKCLLRQWQARQGEVFRMKKGVVQAGLANERSVSVRGFLRWKCHLQNRKYAKAQEQASIPLYTKICGARLLRGLSKCLLQSKSLTEAGKFHGNREKVSSLRWWRAWKDLRAWRRAALRAGIDQRVLLCWRKLHARLERHSVNKILSTTAFATGDKQRARFAVRRAWRCVSVFSRRRQFLKKSFAKLVKWREMMNKKVIFGTFSEYKAEGDSFVLKGKRHFGSIEGKKAFLIMKKYVTAAVEDDNNTTLVDSFRRRHLLTSFFVTYDQNIKLPKSQGVVITQQAAVHHSLWCQQRWLREWRRVLHSMKIAKDHQATISRRFMLHRGLKSLSLKLKKRKRKRLVISKILHVLDVRRLETAKSQWQSRRDVKRVATELENKGTSHHNCRLKMEVITWLKRLRQLRAASAIVHMSSCKRYFDKLRQLHIGAMLGRKLVACTRRVAARRQRMSLRESMRRWAEHCRLESLASKLIAVRTDRLYRNSISSWRRNSKIRKQLAAHGDQCVLTHQLYRQQQIERTMFFNFSEFVNRSKLQRRLDRRCRRHLFRVFQRRILEASSNHELVAARNRHVDSFYLKSLLGYGLRFLMYRVQMKYHRQHQAFLDKRAYNRNQVRAALKNLHNYARSARRFRHSKHALEQHLAEQSKRRVLQLLDCAVVRRWGLKQQEHSRREALAARMMHRGFHCLLKNRHRKRREREVEQ